MTPIIKSLLLFVFFIASSTLSVAQNDLLLPRDVKDSYTQDIRNRNGTPGQNYWQNYGHYTIDVAYNPKTRMVEGEEIITYYNQSPDSLKELVLGLYQEVLSKNSYRYRDIGIDTLKEETMIIEELQIDGVAIDLDKETKKKDTNMFIELDRVILPNSMVQIKVKWHYQMMEGYQIRTGDYGNGVVFVGYFYPRVVVYDDIDGWDKRPYNILHEFYSDFNKYEVNITVPPNYIVSSTGRLLNPEEVLSPKFAKKYQAALKSEKVYSIIDSVDMKVGGITKTNKQLTWKYNAPISPDFAFSVCKNVLWDGLNVPLKSKDVFVDAIYKSDAKDFYQIAQIAADAVKFLSEDFPGVDYPYTDMTIVNGWAAMEFPMMVNDPSVNDDEVAHHLTVHEVGHTYFPFFIGTNERKYAWMDEAWANVFPVFYFESKKMENGYIPHKLERYYRIAGTEEELPIMTLTNYLEYYPAYRHATYSKPSYGLLLLRDLLGKEVFAERLKNYFKNWGFKHPIPFDFFGTFNPDNKPDVNWFYKEFYYKTTYADLSLSKKEDRLIITNTGGLPLGFELIYALKDGTERRINYSALLWRNKAQVEVEFVKGSVKVEMVNQWNLDVNKADNIWE